MERIKNESEKSQKNELKKFHFEEIAEIEPAMTSLVSKLKENIESGKYDTLVSDDIGGRIPTLVLRKIIKEISPKKDFGTFFIAGGRYFPDQADKAKYSKFLDHLKHIARDSKSALLITQYVFRGGTIRGLRRELLDVGLKNVDVAVVGSLPAKEEIYNYVDKALDTEHLFVGSREHHHINEGHEKLSGVRKTQKEYSPFPHRMVDVIAKEGRELSEEEWREIFGIRQGMGLDATNPRFKDPKRVAEYERRERIPLSSEEIKQIQQNINNAREDVSLLAGKVIKKVWNK